MSTVYKGVCATSGARVIIKAYHKPRLGAKHYHKLGREVAAQAVLHGAYVADLYGTFEDAGAVYLVMEVCLSVFCLCLVGGL